MKDFRFHHNPVRIKKRQMKFYIVSRRKDTTLLPHKEKNAQAEIIVYILVS